MLILIKLERGAFWGPGCAAELPGFRLCLTVERHGEGDQDVASRHRSDDILTRQGQAEEFTSPPLEAKNKSGFQTFWGHCILIRHCS